MSDVLIPTQMRADPELDFVVVTLGSLKPRMPWQVAVELCHHLRQHCKNAARFDRARPNFWRDVDMVDLADVPKAHRGFRRSKLQQNFLHWHVASHPPLVALIFDGQWSQMGYEDGVKMHQKIRKAAWIAKAWSGETAGRIAAFAHLTNAEDDYRLGLV